MPEPRWFIPLVFGLFQHGEQLPSRQLRLTGPAYRMNASAFPAAARVFVVATFVTPQDANTVAIRIGLAHPKSLVVDFNKDASPEPKPTRLHPEGLRVCEFAGPATFLVNGTGKHEFVLEADGQEVARATFYVASDSPPKPRR